MKKFLLMALVTATLFSCSKTNEVTPDGGETKTVRLTIKSNTTKADEAAGTARATVLNDLTVYFLNSADGLIETRSIETIEESGSYTLSSVSGLATKLYIVANTKLTSTSLTGSTLVDLKKNALTIATYQKGLDYVVLAAADAVTLSAEARTAGEYTASVTIAPVVARLEIAQLEAISANDQTISDITAFTIEAIYVNGYDPTMTLGGTASDRIAGTTANYKTTDLKDEGLSQTSSNKKITPTKGVWAYQLFPGVAPTMVIQFSSVTFANGNTSIDEDNLCLTVTGFSPDTFVAANIYNVANIQFTSKNIGKPYEATKNVTVTLDVTKWTVKATQVTLQ